MTVKAVARAALVGGLLIGARAHAHPEISAVGTNRYVTAAVFDGRVNVVDALLQGALSSAEERRRLDTDRDGRVSEAERLAGEARLRAEGPAVTADLDGRVLSAPVEVGIDLGGDDHVTAPTLVVERRQSFAGAWTAPGQHRLRLAPTRDPARLLETELSVALGPDVTLAGTPDRVTFNGPRVSQLQDRAATFSFASSPAPRRPVLPVLVLVLVLVLVSVLVLARRYRRRGIDARM
jgi:hypothetical protein